MPLASCGPPVMRTVCADSGPYVSGTIDIL